VIRAQAEVWLPSLGVQLRGYSIALFWRQTLDEVRCVVNRVGRAANSWTEVELRQRTQLQGDGTIAMAIDDCLQVLPPEAVGCADRGSAQEEGGRDA
jgi:hypothetical protein